MLAPLRIDRCDDSSSFLLLVEDWLADYPDLDLVASALGTRDAIEEVRTNQPDVVVTDTMGTTGGDDYLRWVREAAPGAAVVLLTGYRRFQLDASMLTLVDITVTKDVDETELVAALRSLRAA